MLIFAQFPEPFVADTEVVGNFVQDDMLYIFADIVVGPADGFNRLLENGDFIRQHHVVTAGAVGLRHTFIQSEQSAITPRFSPPRLGRSRGIRNQNVDIIHMLEEFIWQAVHCLVYQLFESFTFHRDFIITPGLMPVRWYEIYISRNEIPSLLLDSSSRYGEISE